MPAFTEKQMLKVELGDRSYPIEIGKGYIDSLIAFKNKLIEGRRRVAVVIDAGLAESHPTTIGKFSHDIPTLKIPSGEDSKSVKWLAKGWEFLASNKIDRTGVLFVFGGGVTGDLGGFLAASYLRGIDFVQVPTTLLAMVDSSVGGKTGINLPAGKNLVGSFHQPIHVFIDLDFLDTLPKREFSAGMAEVIKYGMLGKFSLFQNLIQLKETLSPQSVELPEIIHQCCSEKAKIVRGDERESASKGGRALLNLGHTFAHAIEAVAGYGQYLHGEAVAIGLVCAFRLSQKLGYCADESINDLLTLLTSYDLPIELSEPLLTRKLIDAMMNDKKVNKGTLRFVVMEKMGHSFVDKTVDLNLVAEILETIGAH